MFESLVITLREGVEAALVLAIALTVLERRGLAHLKSALFAGAATAAVLSVAVAFGVSKITYNEELAEGIAMMVGAVLTASLVWWMWRAAPHFKREIETGIERAATGPGGSAVGLFLFAFGMVFREGVETAIFLSAAGFNSQGLGLWLGAVAGLSLAAVFGVLFVRGTVKIPLKPFFSVTSAVLILIAAQLVVGGLHELSEAGVLPSSRAEMAIVGPIVKNELLLFTLTFALAAGWLLFGGGPRPAAPEPSASGPEARLALAARTRDARRRRWTGLVALAVVVFFTTAFVRGSNVPPLAPAQPVALSGAQVSVDLAAIGDGHMHFFEAPLREGPVRFFAIQVGDQIKTCYDACEICGAQGYFESTGSLVCRNCTAPIVLTSIGRSGGCNPIPLPHRIEGSRLTIAESDLRAGLPLLQGR